MGRPPLGDMLSVASRASHEKLRQDDDLYDDREDTASREAKQAMNIPKVSDFNGSTHEWDAE